MPAATGRWRPPRRYSRLLAGAEGKGSPRAEEEEGVLGTDYISGLPDAILGDIFSRLPAKVGARTQLLSSRWRHAWRSAPLNLDLRLHRIPLGKVHRVLASHPGPGRRFSTPAAFYGELRDRDRAAATLDGWLCSPALDGLQELDVSYSAAASSKPAMPPSALRFSPTLRVVHLGCCHFPDAVAASGQVHFPNLQHLTLRLVIISEHSLHTMLAGCPALSSLVLKYSYGFRRLRINSRSLNCFAVHYSDHPDDLKKSCCRNSFLRIPPVLKG